MVEERELKGINVLGIDEARKRIKKAKDKYNEDFFAYMFVVAIVLLFIVFIIWLFSGLNAGYGAIIYLGLMFLVYRIGLYTYQNERLVIKQAIREIDRVESNNNLVDVKYKIVRGLNSEETTIYVNGIKSCFVNKVAHLPNRDICILDYDSKILILNYISEID